LFTPMYGKEFLNHFLTYSFNAVNI